MSTIYEQVAELSERLVAAEAQAAEVPKLRDAVERQRNAKEAAERAVASAERECELLRTGNDGEETFEAVLAADLAAMRQAYEAKLALAQGSVHIVLILCSYSISLVGKTSPYSTTPAGGVHIVFI